MNGSSRTTTPAAASSGPAEPAIQHPAYRRMWLATLLLVATQNLPADAPGDKIVGLALTYGRKSLQPPQAHEFTQVMGLTVANLLDGATR